jgi:Zn-finger nucleic acid-binding protein
MIGLSKDHKLNRVMFADFLEGHGMERVTLEGNFSSYFDIYAAKGQQVAVRQTLEPDAMAFVVDYCRSHFWEINSSELYIVATDSDPSKGEKITLLDQSQKFIDEIKPALLPGQPGAAAIHHEIPYGEYDGPSLLCPICQKTMTLVGNSHICPDGHGILVTGAVLDKLHDNELDLKLDIDPSKTAEHKQLTCPNCHNPMEPTQYQGGAVQIDSCTNCPYRWLDAGEVAKIQIPKTEDRGWKIPH